MLRDFKFYKTANNNNNMTPHFTHIMNFEFRDPGGQVVGRLVPPFAYPRKATASDSIDG